MINKQMSNIPTIYFIFLNNVYFTIKDLQMVIVIIKQQICIKEKRFINYIFYMNL